MAIIQELEFFSWKDFQDDLQNLGDGPDKVVESTQTMFAPQLYEQLQI